jgi:hypothetical protein
MIVCIASKGRPDTKTHALFESKGYEVVHFVEPQELQAYVHHRKVIDIGHNDKGIAFVRNKMIDWCQAQNIDWAWFCDDDITAFGYATPEGKTIKADAGLLSAIEERAKKLPFELTGLNYQQHAWREKKEYSVNKNFADCCVLVNVSKIKWRYDSGVNLKEDRDFCIQAVVNGAGVLRYNRIWFSCPNVGSNKGGLQEMYAAKRDEEAAKKMVLKWSPYATLSKKGERIDVKIDLKGIALAHGKEVR